MDAPDYRPKGQPADAGIDALFSRYTFLSDEFYRNYDNLWNFMKYVGAGLTGLVVGPSKLPELSIPAFCGAFGISISGLFLIVHVKRIMVAIDHILCSAYEEYLEALYGGDADLVHKHKYPSSSNMLKGINYVFSIHNCFVSILSGFASASGILLLREIRLIETQDWRVLLAAGASAWIVLIVCIWWVTSRPFKEFGG